MGIWYWSSLFLEGALNKYSSSFAHQLRALKMTLLKVVVHSYAEVGGPRCYGWALDMEFRSSNLGQTSNGSSKRVTWHLQLYFPYPEQPILSFFSFLMMRPIMDVELRNELCGLQKWCTKAWFGVQLLVLPNVTFPLINLPIGAGINHLVSNHWCIEETITLQSHKRDITTNNLNSEFTLQVELLLSI